jgi:hypothetical protein
MAYFTYLEKKQMTEFMKRALEQIPVDKLSEKSKYYYTKAKLYGLDDGQVAQLKSVVKKRLEKVV